MCEKNSKDRTDSKVLPYRVISGPGRDIVKMAVMNFGVAMLAQVIETSCNKKLPAFIEDGKEIDRWIRVSDVEDAINKCLQEVQ